MLIHRNCKLFQLFHQQLPCDTKIIDYDDFNDDYDFDNFAGFDDYYNDFDDDYAPLYFGIFMADNETDGQRVGQLVDEERARLEQERREQE